MTRSCWRCGSVLPDWETHNVCEACDHELYDEQIAVTEAQIAESENEAYEKWCDEQSALSEKERSTG